MWVFLVSNAAVVNYKQVVEIKGYMKSMMEE